MLIIGDAPSIVDFQPELLADRANLSVEGTLVRPAASLTCSDERPFIDLGDVLLAKERGEVVKI